MEIGRAVRKAVSLIEQAGTSRSPALDAYVLLSHCVRKDRLWCHLNRRGNLERQDAITFFDMINRRRAGEPVAYITGRKEFWSREFHVNSHTLIPRPETELLVEHALAFLETHSDRHRLILDLGTGSGIIGVTLALEAKNVTVIATDIDFHALETARENARLHKACDRIQFVKADWLTCFHARTDSRKNGNSLSGFDLITCNPPYVAYSEHRELEKNVVNFEPHAALFSRDNGLFHIKALLDKAPDIMLPGGMLLCETGRNQGKAVKDAALSAGTFKDVSIIRDYAGHDRLLKAQTVIDQ